MFPILCNCVKEYVKVASSCTFVVFLTDSSKQKGEDCKYRKKNYTSRTSNFSLVDSTNFTLFYQISSTLQNKDSSIQITNTTVSPLISRQTQKILFHTNHSPFANGLHYTSTCIFILTTNA